jgi:hypothetical protein
MGRLNIDLEHCYGIKKFKYEFNFSQQRVYAIYAPNGVMKTSLAQTFKDLAEDVPSKDRIFNQRVCSRKITDEKGKDLPKKVFWFCRHTTNFSETPKRQRHYWSIRPFAKSTKR